MKSIQKWVKCGILKKNLKLNYIFDAAFSLWE